MASYVVFASPREGDQPVYLRDSFRWLAFLVPLLWFLWHRLWIEAILVLAAMAVMAALLEANDFYAAVMVVSFLLCLCLGFEAPALRMAALRRRGWRDVAVVEADNRQEAEIRFLAAAEEGATVPPLPAPAPALAHAAASSAPQQPALGLLQYPEGT